MQEVKWRVKSEEWPTPPCGHPSHKW
jgi:hypothetical protein